MYGPDITTSSVSELSAFKSGLSQGYQTMDLLAAFFFAAAAVKYLRNKTSGSNSMDLIKMSVTACIIGASLLAIVYAGFVSLGAKFSHILAQVAPESMLVMVAKSTLGHRVQTALFQSGVIPLPERRDMCAVRRVAVSHGYALYIGV